MAFYSRKPSPNLIEKRELYEKKDGLIFMKERHYEVVKRDYKNNRFITYYIEREVHLLNYDDFHIHINIGPFAGMLHELYHLIWRNFTEESINRAFDRYPALNEFLIKSSFRGVHISAYDFGQIDMKDKDGELLGRLSAYSFNHGNEMSSEYEERTSSILVEFADKAISELSHLSFNPKDLVPIKREVPKQTPEWFRNVQRVGIRVGAKMLSGMIGSNFDIPDVDFGDTNIPDVDWGNIDFDADIDMDMGDYSTDSSYIDYNIPFGHAPNNGSYTNTGKEVTIVTDSGHNKGTFDVYLHQGYKFIDFNNQWINIQGKTRFFLNGNTYIIKK